MCLTAREGEHGLKYKYYAYMVKCRDNTIYSGFAADPYKRESVHNSGNGAKYTRSRLPVKLVYYEGFDTKSEALKRECALKKLTRTEKLRLADGFVAENGNED